MQILIEILNPSFLLRNSVWLGFVVGVACPMVGVYLLLRRTVFLGVALPQVSSCGIALAFALHTWGIVPHLEHGEQALALGGSTALTLAALAGLSVMEHRRRGLGEGRIGLAYALAGAFSILLLVKNPFGEHGLLDRLRGEIIAVSNIDLAITAATFLLVLALLTLFHKELLLVAYDRELALTLHMNPLRWDALLFLLMGLTISIAVYGVGPLVTFGFLLIPPMIAHAVARTMRQFAIVACAVGGAISVIGFALAYAQDLPVGATDVALLGITYLGVLGIRAAWRLATRRPSAVPPSR